MLYDPESGLSKKVPFLHKHFFQSRNAYEVTSFCLEKSQSEKISSEYGFIRWGLLKHMFNSEFYHTDMLCDSGQITKSCGALVTHL